MSPWRPLAACRLLLAALLLGLAGAAGAAPTLFSATLTIELAPGSANPQPLVVQRTGVAAVSPTGGVQIPGGAFAFTGSIPLTSGMSFTHDPLARVLVQASNAPGSFATSVTNSMPLVGKAGFGLDGNFTTMGGITVAQSLHVPLSPIGAAASFTSATGMLGTHTTVTIQNYGPWTTASAFASSYTSTSPFTFSYTRTGSDARNTTTGAFLGLMRFVTPFVVSSTFPGPASSVAGFATLELDFRAAQCGNGLDDDGDTFFDTADPGCRNASDLSEGFDCGNGLDDDLDGLTDFGPDPGCRDAVWALENPRCDNDLDDDADGKIDFDGGGAGPADPQCVGTAWRDNEAPDSCGLGFELVLLLPPLLWLKRRRA